ncbi:MAG: glycosyltransferase [Promethearchaeota archaeon]
MKKRVLFLIPSLEIGGGAEKVAASLTKKLKERYHISIITFYDSSNIYSYAGDYYSLRLKLKSWKRIFLPFKIYRLIKLISPDIILSFMEHTNFLIALIKFTFRIKIPLIICNHTNPKFAFKGKKKYMNFFIRTLYRTNLINKIITVSKEIQNLFENNYNIKKGKTITIYNAINIQEIRELKEYSINYKEMFENSNIIKFITIGRLIELKDHRDLINAFSKVKCEVPSSILIIIGEGYLRKELEELIKKKKLENSVFLIGIIKNPYKYLSKSDIFILNSRYEVFPMVLLEALACGLPIISTNCETGPKEILENGKYGILIKVGDIDNLIKNMIYLAKSEETIKKYAKLSLIRAKMFDINEISKEWVNLIDLYI